MTLMLAFLKEMCALPSLEFLVFALLVAQSPEQRVVRDDQSSPAESPFPQNSSRPLSGNPISPHSRQVPPVLFVMFVLPVPFL